MLYDQVAYWAKVLLLVLVAIAGIVGAAMWHQANQDEVGSLFVLVVAGLCAAILGSRFFR
jgi:hypothetical protein